MYKNFFLIFFVIAVTLLTVPNLISQDISDLDEDFLSSLPDEVRSDIMSEIENEKNSDKNNVQKRPSSQLQKSKIVQNWENFQKQNFINNNSERYGLRLFTTMQTSFMPLNEPNFGNNYILDYGDFLTIQLFGNVMKGSYEVEVGRDGAIFLEDIGKVVVAGLNFHQALDVIKNKYSMSFVGVEVTVELSQVRDINVLITGNIQFPGIYTLSGNSNILQILNIAGGVNENGSLRNIIIKRSGKEDRKIDLYNALIFGDLEDLTYLESGDSIYIEPVKNLVRAGYGFNNTAVFELKDNETIGDLVNFAGGLKIESQNNMLKIVRFENGSFNSYDIDSSQYKDYKIKNLDSIYAFKEQIGTVEISGNVKLPGNYSISSSDRLLDIIQRAGGYNDSAYTFGASLFRESAVKLEASFAEKSYQDIISFLLNNPTGANGASGEALSFLLSELKNYKPQGRIIAEFEPDVLKKNIDDNIFLNDGDKIHIPNFSYNVYVFGEIGNPGAVLFDENDTIIDYINKSGGFTKFSSQDSVFIVDPNGETTKVRVNGVLKFIDQNFDIYPGSVIYVSRNIGQITGINYYATIAPIFSSLALSIASLNSLD